MDQLKDIFAKAMKHGFWIGSAVVFLCSLGFWYLSTSKLADESEKQTSSIKSSIMTVSNIQAELSTHPNEISHARMQELIKDRQNQVLESWETLFERQREILVWPEEELTKRFVDQFRDKIPIEVYVPFPTPESDELTTSMRSTYAKHIKDELPDLAEIAGTEWLAEFSTSNATGMMGRGGRTNRMTPEELAMKEKPLVVWSEQSQASLLSDLFPWRQSGLPKTLDIYYSQENLWVLRQLLEIIGEVNGPAKQPYQAKIHEINSISIGSSVKFGAGSILPPGANSTTGIGGGMGGMPSMGMGDMDMDMDLGMGMGMGGEEASPDPADLRYVSESLESITAADLRTALKDIKPQNVSLAIAKRLPVMMSLKMNQRAVPELLAACGSANLMVKVRQTRIMPKGKTTSPAGSGGGAGMGMGMGMDDMDMGMDEEGLAPGGGMGMGGMGMGRGGMGRSGATDQPVDEFPLDMQVEIYGIIYIYNPPDLEKLAIEQITEETVDQAVQDLSGETKPDTNAAQPPAGVPGQPGAGQVPAAGDDTLPVPGVPPADAAPAPSDPGIGNPGIGNPGIGEPGIPGEPPAGPVTAVPVNTTAPTS
jgi:hypothetical protein